MDELALGLRRIKTGKAAGLDGVSNELLKHLPDTGKMVLLRLINSSWDNGVCAGKWREGEIIPFQKAVKRSPTH